jgi:hypothetical protein
MKCEDAGQVCDKNQYEEASFWEKLKLKVQIMSLQDKEDLKEQIHQEITK